MTKPIIAVDFDDVVADFNRPFATFHNRHFNTDITYEAITQFDLCAIYQIDHGTFVERAMRFCHEHHDEINLIPGAAETLRQLQARFELHIVTSRSSSLKKITESWLEQHLPGLFTDTHFVNQHHHQNEPKSIRCREIDAQLLIDDAWHHIADAVAANLKAILVNRPWNQTPLPRQAVRVSDWNEVSTLTNSLLPPSTQLAG